MRKKQITALGLLLMVSLPIFLSVGIFIKQKIVQFQRIQRFETEHLQTISISANKIYWVKKGKEILVGGKLFDVKSFKTNGSQIILTGFYDHKEDSLVKNIADLIHDDNDSRYPPNQFIIKFLCFPAYKELTGFSMQSNWQIIDRHFPSYSESLSTLHFATALPPPKSC